MLGNLKEFISVVQDGLTSNNNLRQTLQEVQKVTNIFRDKQKVNVESKVNYGAGGALLEKYQEQWAEMHENADKNATAADEVDKLILELHEVTKYQLKSAHDLAQSLSQIPKLTASLAQCMDSMNNVQSLLSTVEEELVEFEDIVERRKMENWKLDHQYHLTLYKEKKMHDADYFENHADIVQKIKNDVLNSAFFLVALEDVRNQLAKENTQKSYEQERQQLAELQTKRENSAVAFQQDVAKYLISGTVPVGPHPRQKITLEQVQLDEDNTDLEKFLDS